MKLVTFGVLTKIIGGNYFMIKNYLHLQLPKEIIPTLFSNNMLEYYSSIETRTGFIEMNSYINTDYQCKFKTVSILSTNNMPRYSHI